MVPFLISNVSKFTVMYKVLLSLLLCHLCFSSNGQIGFSTPIFRGPDKDTIASNWGITAEVSFPFAKKINLKDTSKSVIIVFQPSLRFESLNFEENLIVEKNNDLISFIPDSDASHIYKKGFLRTSSMMQTTSFHMPIEIWLEHKKLPGVRFAPGFYIEYILGGQFKQKFSSVNGEEKYKTKFKSDSDYFGLNRFQFGPCAHISYKFLTIYGIYSLQSMFKANQNINVSRYNFGIWVNFFYKRRRLKPY